MKLSILKPSTLIFKGVISIILITNTQAIFSQKNDSITSKTFDLKEIEISGRRTPTINSDLGRVVTVISREEISKMAATSAADILEYVGNIDIRTRGTNGVQADMSFRGGTFDQVMILLNGVNITDPQTGHHNLNLPIDIQSIERIEILQGSGARAFGPNAFSGAINFITGSSESDNIKASVTGGMYKYQNENINTTIRTGKLKHFASTSFVKTDGFNDNTDLKGGTAFYQGLANLGDESLELQAGYTEKQFGANSFYSTKFPNQNEQLKTFFASLKLTGGEKIKYSVAAYQRTNQDHFEMLIGSAINHSYSLTDVMGVNFNTYMDWEAGRTSIGTDIRSETIWSNKLGYAMNDTLKVPGEGSDALFTKKYSRANSALFLEHSYAYKRFSFSVGLLMNWNSGLDYSNRYYPGIDVSYRINNSLSAFGNANKSLRMPTFTDMFNTSGNRIGDDELMPEESKNYEVGLKHFSRVGNGSVLIFLRDGKNMIDWGSYTNEFPIYYARNIASIKTTGFEINYNLNVTNIIGASQPIKSINIAYTNINQDLKPIPNYTSLYALDYLNYKMSIRLNHKIYKALDATWTYLLEDRAGSYKPDATMPSVPYPVYGLLNGRIAWSKPKYQIYTEASNLLNKEYVDIAGIEQPGIWVKVGATINLNL